MRDSAHCRRVLLLLLSIMTIRDRGTKGNSSAAAWRLLHLSSQVAPAVNDIVVEFGNAGPNYAAPLF